MITHSILIDIDRRAVRAHPDMADAINRACVEFGIVNLNEIAAFLAQCAVESAGFCRLEENLNYTSASRLCQIFPSRFKTEADALPCVRNPEKIANRVYALKIGNGDEASGDGWRYRGRGLKQLTGRSNYEQCAKALKFETPDYLLTPEGAARSAAWFWVVNRCGKILKDSGIDAVTRVVNGPGMLGLAERRDAFERGAKTLETKWG
jgi:putative chitinase